MYGSQLSSQQATSKIRRGQSGVIHERIQGMPFDPLKVGRLAPKRKVLDLSLRCMSNWLVCMVAIHMSGVLRDIYGISANENYSGQFVKRRGISSWFLISI